ncbi:MAG: restriction endonuclease subunit S [Limisphaerales bacterium]
MSAPFQHVGRVPPRGAAPTGRKKSVGRLPLTGVPPNAAALDHDSKNTSSSEGPKGAGISHSSRGFDAQGNALPVSAITANELPPGWRWLRVKEIGDVQLGRQRAPKHQNGANMRPYLRVANVFEDRIDLSDVLSMNFTPREFDTFALRANDILLNEGQSLHLVGRPALYRDELPGACFQNTLVRFRPGPDVDPKFALTIFRGYMHTGKFQKIARWTTNIAHLGAQRFAEMPFPLPPLPEQRRIVAEIEKQFTRLEAGVSALRRVQANLKRYRAAVLKAACEGQLVPTEAELHRQRKTKSAPLETSAELLTRILAERRKNWTGRGQYKEPAAPDTANLPPLPEGWTWATFDQISTLITKGSSPNWQGFNYCDEGIIFVRSENVRWGSLDLSDVAHLPPAFNDKERKSILCEGDVLLNLVGASIGRAAIATAEVDGGNVNQAVAVIRLVAKEPMNQFAMLWLNSSEAQKRIHAEKVDVARANFSLEDTRILPFPLPPLAEQTRIAAEVERRLSVLEELETVVSANLQRATRLRQSILQKAFTGGLV